MIRNQFETVMKFDNTKTLPIHPVNDGIRCLSEVLDLRITLQEISFIATLREVRESLDCSVLCKI